MQQQSPGYRGPYQNPFRTGPQEVPAAYENVVQQLARRFIYLEKTLNAAQIEQALAAARRDPKIDAEEKNRHDIACLSHLLRGMVSHELANSTYRGAWQAALVRQETNPEGPRAPETLSREEVAREFAAFAFKKTLVEAEQKALAQYEALLKLKADASITLSSNISIQRTDIEVLMNDIRARMIEREPDEAKRKAEILKLDRELEEIIRQIPDDERGKKFEVMEIYLLRQLIHTMDTGHLASISHGTPREDLRKDMGSVDVEVTAAGEVHTFQLKTFKYGVSKPAREKQLAILEEARRNLSGSKTKLAVLEAEAVQETYEASLRQSRGTKTSKADKFATLEPLAEELGTHDSHRLLALLGLTAEDLESEQAEASQRQGQRSEQEAELRTKREEEAQRFAEVEERKKSERAESEKEERMKLETIERIRLEDIENARVQREAIAKAKEEKQLERQTKRAHEMEEQRRAEAEKRAEIEKLVLKEQRAEERKKKAEEGPAWPPKLVGNLGNAPMLKSLGFLPEDWKGDAMSLLVAKKQFRALFGVPKKGAKDVMDTDKTSPLFAEIFPTKESLETPSEEILARVRGLIGKK